VVVRLKEHLVSFDADLERLAVASAFNDASVGRNHPWICSPADIQGEESWSAHCVVFSEG
jgi:hypothetical protein